jgi:restriction system protein
LSIPSQNDTFKLVLQIVANETEFSRRQAMDLFKKSENLTCEEQNQITNSGTPVYESRVGWAVTWLNQAEYVERLNRGIYRITPLGKKLLSENITSKEFVIRLTHDRMKNQPAGTIDDKIVDFITDLSPEEMISNGSAQLQDRLASEIMTSIMAIEGREGDTFFEKLVTDLLVHMGYGEGHVTSPSNDGGVDGIIATDSLGFDPIYIQAKRYAKEHKIGRPDIQAFAGALGAITRGVFITTSDFRQSAKDYAKTYPHADIALINGRQLIELMIQYDLGVTTENVIKIKRIDSDYFSLDD